MGQAQSGLSLRVRPPMQFKVTVQPAEREFEVARDGNLIVLEAEIEAAPEKER